MLNLRRLKKAVTTPTFRSQVQKVFFEAMNAGYAAEGKPKKGTIVELPGSKTITYAKGPWVVLDAYQVTPISSFSGGTTHIWYEGVEVWMMQYFGWYREDAVPFLKTVLRTAYSEGKFYGGRGEDYFAEGGYIYTNHGARGSNFEAFAGNEHIVEFPKYLIVGRHSYHGGFML